MPRPKGSLGETKLKILAIICFNERCNEHSYGYNVWLKLKEKFHCYMNDGGLRNVYHHLESLHRLGLITKNGNVRVNGAPPRMTYVLTESGKALRNKYEKYLRVLM
ncbi:helix-turn-helix transcriptional regulator [Candidatus Bathyarchaeota archaeon]|nr:helix-turn-helix transcriptional regulator [Candidatus Bathyarchaeota archaeon]